MTRERGQRFGLLWFCVAAVLTTATQLRMPGLPVGPGELLLVLWLLAAGIQLLYRGSLVYSPTSRVILGFWALSLVALCGGALINLRLGLYAAAAGHDSLALIFAATLVSVLAVYADHPRFAARTAGALVWTSAGLLLPLLLVALVVPRVGPINPWYSIRFRGWAENPNQLALAVVAVPFLAVHLARAATGRRRTAYALLAAGAVVVGIASLSDALLVSWACALAVLLVVLWTRSAARTHTGYLSAALTFFVIPLLVVLAAVAVGGTVLGEVMEEAQAIYQEGNQGSVRLVLWMNGLRTMLISPVVGLGPGAHSALYDVFGESEAHNTFIDWGASTGFLGLSLYLGLLAWALVRIRRTGSLPLLGAFIALVVFSVFHYVIRHPIFWFTLIVLANLPSLRAASAVAGRKAVADPAGLAGVA